MRLFVAATLFMMPALAMIGLIFLLKHHDPDASASRPVLGPPLPSSSTPLSSMPRSSPDTTTPGSPARTEPTKTEPVLPQAQIREMIRDKLDRSRQQGISYQYLSPRETACDVTGRSPADCRDSDISSILPVVTEWLAEHPPSPAPSRASPPPSMKPSAPPEPPSPPAPPTPPTPAGTPREPGSPTPIPVPPHRIDSLPPPDFPSITLPGSSGAIPLPTHPPRLLKVRPLIRKGQIRALFTSQIRSRMLRIR